MADKWSYERLLTEWSNLVKTCSTLDEFPPKRDALIQESGWNKLEFYTAMDKLAADLYRKAL